MFIVLGMYNFALPKKILLGNPYLCRKLRNSPASLNDRTLDIFSWLRGDSGIRPKNEHE
jgi:hypothetical protein